MKNKLLKTITSLASLFLISLGTTPIMANAESGSVSTYLVLSSIGLYQGQKGTNYTDLFLENTIRYDAQVGSPLPTRSDISTIASSQGVFASWVRYEKTGAPVNYTNVPNEDGAILYAYYVNSNLSLVSLSASGTPTKNSYNLDEGENVFDSTGLTITAHFSDSSTLDVTSSVIWPSLTLGMTSIVGTYTNGGVSRTITINGLSVTGTEQLTTIYLNAGGSSLWDQSDAWFAAYCWNSDSNTWYTLSATSDYYAADIDIDTYTNIIFVRFANTATVASWDDSATNIWNQTGDLTFDGNCYTITGWNATDGAWSNL
ncbi:MAG: hypothetical protein WC201_04385 [Bacilli bacterium]